MRFSSLFRWRRALTRKQLQGEVDSMLWWKKNGFTHWESALHVRRTKVTFRPKCIITSLMDLSRAEDLFFLFQTQRTWNNRSHSRFTLQPSLMLLLCNSFVRSTFDGCWKTVEIAASFYFQCRCGRFTTLLFMLGCRQRCELYIWQ